MNTILIYILLALGEGIICAGFFLGLKGVEPENLFYLNLAAVSLSYILIFINAFNLTKQVSKSEHSPAGLGALIKGLSFYVVAVVFAVICSYAFKWSLPLALVIHAILLFVLLLYVIFARVSVSNVTSAMEEIEERKSSLNIVKAQLDSLELEVKVGINSDKYSPMIDTIREDIRYITPSSSEAAQNLEERIAVEFRTMSMVARGTDEDSHRRWLAAANSVNALIKLRKQQI